MKLVLIEWTDSQFGDNDWLPKEYFTKFKSAHCVNGAILIEERKDEIVICPHISGDKRAQAMCIPRSAIKRMRKLEIKRR